MLQDWTTRAEGLVANVADLGARLLQAAILLALGLALASLARHLSVRLLRRAAVEVQYLVSRIAYLAVLVGTSVWILSTLNVQTALVATALGAITLALSLSLQDVARNLVAGMYLLMERPFKVGDHISSGGVAGRVEYVGVRATTLRTASGEQVIIPNINLMSGIVTRAAPVAEGSPSPAAATSAPPSDGAQAACDQVPLDQPRSMPQGG